MNASNTAKPINEQLNALSQKRHLWVLPALVAGAVVLGVIFGLIPQYKSINEGRTELKALEEQLSRLEAKRQQLERISDAQLDSQLLVVSRALPNEKPVSQALGILMNKTGEFEVTMANYEMSPGDLASGSGETANQELAAEPGRLADMMVKTSLTGLYGQAVEFLRNLEDQIVPMSRALIVTFALNEGGLERGQAETGVDLEMNISYAQPPDNIGKTSDPLPEITDSQLILLERLAQRQPADLETSTIPLGVEENKPNIFQF